MYNRKKVPEGMYRASEAIAAIGISSTAFYDLVKEKIIKKIVPPGRSEGFYSKSEIDTYARNWKALNAPYLGEKLDFGLALVEDLPEVHSLVARVSGGPAHAVPESVLKAWIRRNPQSIHVLRRKNEVIGYVSGFPLEPDTLMRRLDGHVFNRDIPIDDIQTFKNGTTIAFYVAEMAVKPAEGDTEPDEHLGAILIRHTARFILYDLKKQGVTVNQLYAVGTSAFGIKMCKKLGMQSMDLATGVREDRIPFTLSIETDTASRFIRRLVAA